MPRLQQHRVEAGANQTGMEPLRQRPSFESDTANLQLLRLQVLDQHFGLARNLRLTDDAALRIHDAHAGQFQ
jgi:hypothetical protein